jgi:hypothetical protein
MGETLEAGHAGKIPGGLANRGMHKLTRGPVGAFAIVA